MPTFRPLPSPTYLASNWPYCTGCRMHRLAVHHYWTAAVLVVVCVLRVQQILLFMVVNDSWLPVRFADVTGIYC